MGARGGPLWRRWVYWVPRGEEREGRLEVTDGQGRVSWLLGHCQLPGCNACADT